MSRLDADELRSFRAIQQRAPFRLAMRHVPMVRGDVASLLSWLDAYVSTVDREAAKLREADFTRARAATVLAGLRRDLENGLDTVRELDAAIESGELPVMPPRLVPEPPPGVEVDWDAAPCATLTDAGTCQHPRHLGHLDGVGYSPLT